MEHRFPHTVEENWVPLSEVRTAGTPKRLTQKPVMSVPMFLHTKREEISHLVALMSGCSMEWMLVKTPFLQLTGTKGLGLARETSHMRFFLPKGKNFILSDAETAASCNSVHSS